ncbi:hypothetical protein [Moraxella bovis]|uniref:Uncharacterized protein n=1 Tax=Moraxella bovis TaxID=476 RepID=A0A1T0A3A2_MORBO|nr:hypothetical protein [Moraxella bovis]OOR89811.1 hypothetical protein B0182_06560 [Moraxella bovis]STY90176.1 Uncharacterised protein [Moraxella bovis]
MSRPSMVMDAQLFCQERQELVFNEFCLKVQQLLRHNPTGLTVANVQRQIGMSYKTAMRVLALVAVEKDGKFYPRQPLGGKS